MNSRANALRAQLASRVLTAPGDTSPDARRAAFDHLPHDPRIDPLLSQVTRQAWSVADADVAAPLSAGVSEDAVFELVVCAAVGQATRQLDSAMTALALAAGDHEETT